MNRIALICTLTLLGATKSLTAQSDFYSMDHIAEIRLYFDRPDWNELLDSLYVAGESERLGGDVVIDGVRYEDVGVRYKGFSSYSSDRNKNPFNIDLDYVLKDQNHQGFNKIKLSNVIQDPSFVRETLSYEIARKYMSASRANYANVYVNDTLMGLYTNVEAVGGTFLENYFGESDGAMFKGNPEDLDLNGENANLGDSPGTSVDAYYPYYKLESGDIEDWLELYELIDILNNQSTEIPDVLNVDQTLWMHAFNYAVINFDSYVGYAQNYYLYRDADKQFNPILWDLNMSFASYRLTDASDNWDGFTITEAMTIDPLQHLNSFSVQPRPLMRNLFENATWKRMYLAHLRTIMEENFDNQWYAGRAAELQTLVDPSVQADTNKFYTYQDFLDNLNSTVSDLIDYPGITQLMDGRSAYLSTYPGIQGAPDIWDVSAPAGAMAGDEVYITAEVSGTPENVLLAYRMSGSLKFSWAQMLDDGLSGDGAQGDGVFGARIEGITNKVEYFVYAENDSSGRFSPERAAHEFYTLNAYIRPGDLVINEVMTANAGVVSDQDGESDPWIELFNNSSYSIDLSELYLSDESVAPLKWEFPDQKMAPGDYLIVWADGDSAQSGLHTTFRFTNAGDSLLLSHGDGTLIDQVFCTSSDRITSGGRYPNATGAFREMIPSPDRYNDGVSGAVLTDAVLLYPNPADNVVLVRINQDAPCELSFFALDGRRMSGIQSTYGGETLEMDVSRWPVGVYLVLADFGTDQQILKLMITH